MAAKPFTWGVTFDMNPSDQEKGPTDLCPVNVLDEFVRRGALKQYGFNLKLGAGLLGFETQVAKSTVEDIFLCETHFLPSHAVVHSEDQLTQWLQSRCPLHDSLSDCEVPFFSKPAMKVLQEHNRAAFVRYPQQDPVDDPEHSGHFSVTEQENSDGALGKTTGDHSLQPSAPPPLTQSQQLQAVTLPSTVPDTPNPEISKQILSVATRQNDNATVIGKFDGRVCENPIIRPVESDPPTPLQDLSVMYNYLRTPPDANREAASLRTYWENATKGRGQGLTANCELLRPSLEKLQAKTAEGETLRQTAEGVGVECVQKINEGHRAVTSVVFGQETQHPDYYLMACASLDGTICVYRVYRTELERASTDGSDDTGTPHDPRSLAVLHKKLLGHQEKVVSMEFVGENQAELFTASFDQTMRYWDVQSGKLKLGIKYKSGSLLTTAFLPLKPQVLIVSTTKPELCLIDTKQRPLKSLQTLECGAMVLDLAFDDTGAFCFAGTRAGHVAVYEVQDTTLEYRYPLCVSDAPVSCVRFVSGKDTRDGMNPILLVNHADGAVSVVDCLYGPHPGVLYSVNVPVRNHSLPIRSCYSTFGGGHLVSGSEDNVVIVYSFGKFLTTQLELHTAAVVEAAVNRVNTLLVTADMSGTVALWRRYG
uniref:Guanine nucleotide-binding protein subunit beta-like protein n=1 Tax=Chromera velia CCMP2878 TaxID=1169474 RepID=A0A0G4I4N8_9ALVE|eukprot:Cvel_10954.t1-p1 / transcript=Cvel_10954.t1 / gene=Cvel_10954 / organism=Chromera_velia_CCMP2878 / gene_product=WD repeat-containing protein 13, putative / transcript_product=WD repeat-containing protein 13, putative / location=Cvel_scaffold673:61801-64983(-) / protein_length=649 / sequence_SO=supercontig / SO=protein_coding / is_pseudo=false